MTEEMRRLAGYVLEVLTGYQRGGEALALPGEPRPQYAPGTAKLQRCQAKAAELGVSVMTVRRMIWRFEADGPEGLTDRRRQRRSDPLGGADARWLDMARRVLAGHTEASKPTRDLHPRRDRRPAGAEHGDGMVPVPKPTRARALLCPGRGRLRGRLPWCWWKARFRCGPSLRCSTRCWRAGAASRPRGG